MIKYLSVAATLKAFSTSSQTKQLYRFLGNSVGQNRRVRDGLSKEYVSRAKRILHLFEKYRVIQPGDRLLEIGTGWIHWESTIIRLFYDVEITLFDVWDNRQFDAYQRFFGQLERVIDSEIEMNHAQQGRVHQLLWAIAKAHSFDEVYALLGFQYIVDPGGTLKGFRDESFAAIYSCNVLEHVDSNILQGYIQDFHRLLKPDGFSLHQIDPGDHLAYYDRGRVCLKNYLRYPDSIWERYFENSLQYFNRVQRSEWLCMFDEAGFELLEEESIPTDISSITIDERYKRFSQEDLQCLILRVVHRRPLLVGERSNYPAKLFETPAFIPQHLPGTH